MESTSKANSIHCSERAAKLVKKQHPEVRIKKRGWIPIKGKGEMKTYWINEGNTNRRQESNESLLFHDSGSSASSKPSEGSDEIERDLLPQEAKICEDDRHIPELAALPEES